ncbi:putative FMN-binding domain-containing protein, partial [Cerioporus squamosus]
MTQFISVPSMLVFSALRALGVTRNTPFSILILILSIVPLAINISTFHFSPTGIVVPELGCVYTETMSEQTAKMSVFRAPWITYLPVTLCSQLSTQMSTLSPSPTWPVTIVSRVSLITADVLLGLATWFKLSAGGAHRRMKAGTFAYTLLMDGTIYFIALSVLNTLHLVLTLLSAEGKTNDYAQFGTEHENVSVVTDFTEPLTGVLVSRFLMDLQTANRRALNTDSSLYSQGGEGPFETIVFERVVGSLASTIPPPHAGEVDARWSGSDEGTVDVPSEGGTCAVEEDANTVMDISSPQHSSVRAHTGSPQPAILKCKIPLSDLRNGAHEGSKRPQESAEERWSLERLRHRLSTARSEATSAMYLRAVHAEHDIPTLREFIRANPLGIFTTAIDAPDFPFLQSSHIPWLLDVPPDAKETDLGTLRGHMARANPQVKAMIAELTSSGSRTLSRDVLVLFNLPAHHYVTPKFYTETKPATGKTAPTWDYAAVQVYGRATVYFDAKAEETDAFLSRSLRDLSQ